MVYKQSLKQNETKEKQQFYKKNKSILVFFCYFFISTIFHEFIVDVSHMEQSNNG